MLPAVAPIEDADDLYRAILSRSLCVGIALWRMEIPLEVIGLFRSRQTRMPPRRHHQRMKMALAGVIFIFEVDSTTDEGAR